MADPRIEHAPHRSEPLSSSPLLAMARPPGGPDDPGDPGGPGGPDRRTGRPGEQTVLERDPKVHKPRMWRVLLHNDDYTTIEFVVWVLQRVFAMGIEEASALTMAIHKTGRGVAGVFTRDIAETKAVLVLELAEENGMPLMCTTEPDD